MRQALGTALAAVAGTLVAQPALAAPVSGTTKVTTVKSLSITKTRDLDFGTLIAGAGGTVTIDPVAGTRVAVGVVARGAGASTGRLVGAGTPDRIVGVGYPGGALTLRQTTGTATMTLETVTSNVGLPLSTGYDLRLIPQNGLVEVLLGGRLRVGANQTAGEYSATFNVSIDYY